MLALNANVFTVAKFKCFYVDAMLLISVFEI